MKDHLKPEPLVTVERFNFHRRTQAEGETVAQYVAEFRKLADKCDFGTNLDEALTDRLMLGVRSEKIQTKLLTEKKLTLDKAYSIAQGMETAIRQAGEVQATLKVTPPSGGTPVNFVAKNPQRSQCFRCGKNNHSPDNCFYRRKRCRSCGKLGHIAKMCKGDKNNPGPAGADHRADLVEQEEHPAAIETDELPLFNIQMVKNQLSEPSITITPEVNTVSLPMELDTGASVSLISDQTLREHFPNTKLTPSDVRLKTYTGERLTVLGEMTAQVRYRGQECTLPLLVVSGRGPSLFGRNWLQKLKLDWGSIKRVSTELEELLSTHQAVFRKELGTLKGFEAKLFVRPGAIPKFFKPRSVPYSLKGAIEQDLERLETLGVIEKVQYSDWAAPIVPVQKANGTIRLCGDYKVTVNPALKVDQYPVPKPEDLFATLAGGKKFSKLDLSHAYQQVLLEADSRQFVTINTHKGLYRYSRLPFGIASAPAVFQQIMEKILNGIPKVVVYIDDILVSGTTDAEHLENLGQVLTKLEEHGLRLKREKCSFMQPSVEYLGYLIDAEGIHTTPEKVAAIVNAPEPKNTTELRSFLGLVNYYGKFIRNLSSIAHPLNRLLCKDAKWTWSQACQEAFQELKAKLSSSEVLVHYDEKLPLKLDCDASSYGIGAVLSHVYPDGSERPIAYASRSLTSAEVNYAQIEKEGLALIYGVKKFHQFVYGRSFTLVTDHQPLMAILGSKKGLPTLAAARLQRWAILLAAYQYDLEFRGTAQHCNADGFSRLPLPTCETGEDPTAVNAAIFNLQQIETLPVDAKQLKQATLSDPLLSKVLLYTQKGWPAEYSDELKPYFHKRHELSVEAGCLLWGVRVVVPPVHQTKVLEELHCTHPGMVRMKGLARAHVWWPNIDQQIEQRVHDCDACQSVRNQPPTTVLHPWAWPDSPWKRIHVDFAGPFMGSMFMVVVDAHSKWLEVIPMSTTTTEKTLDALRNLFAAYGIPQQLVSDNGPQFTSKEFQECMVANGIRHTLSAPYHPATNGAAERFVQTFKHSMKAAERDPGTMVQKLARFLLMYRTTPHSTTGVTPAELFLKRSLRTRLDLLRPSVQGHVETKQMDQKRFHDTGSVDRNFDVGQTVLVRNLRDGPKWLQGVIVEKSGPVSYRVDVQGQIWSRHIDQLLDCKGVPTRERVTISDPCVEVTYEPPPTDTSDLSPQSIPQITLPITGSSPHAPDPSNPTHSPPNDSISPRYPSRVRKPPERLEITFD